MSFENILVESGADGIVRLTLNRPAERNAMSPEMGVEVEAAVTAINADPSARVVVVTGAGKAFSAGGNLDALEQEALATRGEGTGRGLGGGRNFYRRYLSIRRLEVPTIAAINGAAVGAGLCFALGCDVRIAHQRAKMGMTFVRLGIHPGMGATWTLPRLVGPAWAADLLLSGRLIDAPEAARIGLVSGAYDDPEFAARVEELAKQIADAGPVAVRATKRTLQGTFARELDAALGLEANEQAMTFTTDDALEGIRAIREKRPPAFHGR